MTQYLTNSRFKRLIWVVIATAISVAWLPAWVFARGNAKEYGLVKGMNCYMEPEFFRDNGVSARQICLDDHVNIGILIAIMVLGAMVPCLTLVIRIAAKWVAGSAKSVPEPAAAAVTKSSAFAFPTYTERPQEETHGQEFTATQTRVQSGHDQNRFSIPA